jgi:ATP synthase subunit 6
MVFKKQIFLGYLIYLFFFILFSNVFGMVPYNSTVTSYFVLSFFFASITFIGVTIVGIRYHRINFLQIFLPDGVPKQIAIFGLLGIEIISYFSRVLSLSIRLFANMMSGHTLLKILLGFA